MIVDDRHVVRVAAAPDETDPEPVVDTDTVLALSIAAQRFEAVPGEGRQVPKLVRRVQLAEFPLDYTGDALKAARRVASGEALRRLVCERPDHEEKRYNVLRYMSNGIGWSF